MNLDLKNVDCISIAVSALVVALVFSVGCRKTDPRFMSPLGVGAAAPEIAAAGWIHGVPGSAEGKVVVVDCWGYW